MINVQQVTQSEGPLLVKPSEAVSLPEHSEIPDTANPKEVAEYSAALLSEIRDISGRSGLTFLAYLVQVALEEAKIQAGNKSNDK